MIGVCIIFGIYRGYQTQARGAGDTLVNSSRVMILTALDAYYRDQRAKHNARPSEVPLSELVSRGYVRADEVHGLDGKKITVELQGKLDREALPLGLAVPGGRGEPVLNDSVVFEGNDGPDKLVLRWTIGGEELVGVADIIHLPGELDCSRFAWYSPETAPIAQRR